MRCSECQVHEAYGHLLGCSRPDDRESTTVEASAKLERDRAERPTRHVAGGRVDVDELPSASEL